MGNAVKVMPDATADLLLATLPALERALDGGSVVVLEEVRIRVRSLPIDGDD
jgi:hypothetical protein